MSLDVAREVIEETKDVAFVKTKAADMNSSGPEEAFRVIAGTARSMGIEVVD